MKLKLSIFSLLIIIFIGCSSDSEPTQESKDDDEIVAVDETPPSLNINGLDAEVEINSIIEVSIEDESSVETRILINNTEMISTTEKQFSYEINPYKIPVGEALVKVISEDASKNTVEQEFKIEIRHLLMEFNLGSDENDRYSSIWTFFNDSQGNLIQVLKSELGSTKIYTEDLITEDFIFYTISKFNLLGDGQNKGLRITTYKMKLGEKRNEINFSEVYDLTDEVKIDINLEENDNGFDKYFAQGSGYDTFGGGTGSFLTSVAVSYDNPDNIYLRTSVIGGGPELFDGKKENYVYYKFEPNPSTPLITLNQADLYPAEESVQLTIPDHMPGSFVFDRAGFENQEDVVKDINHEIFNVQEPNDQYRDYIDLPIVQGLNLYNNTVVYFNEGKSFYASLFGNNLDINMPDWNIDFGIEKGNIFLEEKNDLDYYVVRFTENNTSDINNLRFFTWDYRTFESTGGNQEVPILDLPSEILDEINDDFYNNYSNYLTISTVTGVDFELFNSFTEVVDWLGLSKTPLTLDQLSYKEVSFYANSLSGKKMNNNHVIQQSPQ